MEGYMVGVLVNCIYLDTGCSQMLVRRELIPKGDILAESVELKCVHGDVARYPLVFVEVVVEGRRLKIKAGVAEKLPVDVLLGTDVPELMELVSAPEEKCLVVTRVQTQWQHTEEEREKKLNETARVTLKTVELDDEVDSIFPFDDELFQEVKDRVKKTKSEKRVHNRQRLEDEQRHWLEMSGEELKEAQQTDDTLDGVRETLVLAETAKEGKCYEKEGMLYQRGRVIGGKTEAVEQLVLPRCCRQLVFELAHTIPLAGHLGQAKTRQRLLQRFFGLTWGET